MCGVAESTVSPRFEQYPLCVARDHGTGGLPRCGELDYTGNAHARRLARGSSRFSGILLIFGHRESILSGFDQGV